MLSLSITFYLSLSTGQAGLSVLVDAEVREWKDLRWKSLHAVRGSSGRKNGSGETPAKRRVDLYGLPKSTGLDRPAGLGTISKHLWGSEWLHFRVAAFRCIAVSHRYGCFARSTKIRSLSPSHWVLR